MKNRTLKSTLTALLLTAAPTGLHAEPSDLFDAIDKRLSYMQAVAAWKVDNNRPVEDLAREKVVLDAARTKAGEVGLSGDSVTGFFQAQIDAAKDIQTCWIGRWNDGADRPTDVPDLVEDVRPALLTLGNEILQLMATEKVSLEDQQAFTAALTVDCLSPEAKDALFDGLLEVQQP